LSKQLSKKLKSVRKAIRSFEQKFEKRGYRSPFKIHPPLVEKVSLIVPTYNVEPYIEEFLASVTSQTTGLRNLEVIIVDDGSTDRSGEIAQAWARRFPKTIKYIRQENRGLSGARNTGLDHATGEWVSFPDPDDILDRKWLHALNKELKRKHEREVLLVARPIRFYYDQLNVYRPHPLSGQYVSRQEIRAGDPKDFILLSANSTFFSRKAIEDLGIRFDSKVRPTFEDGHFINKLIALYPDRALVVLPKPFYIYRKRGAFTSLVDGSKTSSLWYTDQIRFGYLNLLRSTVRGDGTVPRFVQRVVLYDVGWRFKHLLNHAERAAFLSDSQLQEFKTLLNEVLAYIESETIREMNRGPVTEEYKVGLLSTYKNEDRSNDFIYLHQYDEVEQMIQLSLFGGGDSRPDVKIFVDGKAAELCLPSKRTATFLDEPFYTEYRFWVPVYGPEATLLATINGRPASFRRGGGTLGYKMSVARALKALKPSPAKQWPEEAIEIRDYVTSDSARARFANCWVLMDRDDAADDNAEHLYRYLMKNGRVDRAFFVLREESADWDRLKTEGFKLLPFGSKEHVAALVNADVLASSHADHFILWPVAKEWIQDLARYKYVFLQHGVTKHDLSNWLNAKPIRLFVTAAPDEYNSIANTSSNYLFSERETKLTGFPRHDRLLSRPQKRDAILIMPTWRRYLVGETTGAGMKREPMADFIRTQYARAWRDLLVSDRLRQLAEYHGKEIVFCPHPNMAMYLEQFDLPAYIRCRDPRLPPSIQETFAEAALMVTDYSSVAFECAYIDRPIVYFQFDRDEFFAGDHVCTRGYFDYREHGFGPVVETGDQVLDAIQQALEGREDPIYAQRRESFFAFRDGRCCERVYNEILKILPDTGDQLKASAQGMQEAAE